MRLTTSFPIAQHDRPIDHDSKLMLLGSCFAQNIGDKLSYYGFDAMVNPFGTIFNPYSLRLIVERSVRNHFTLEDVERNFSYLAHSDMNGENAVQTLDHLKTAGLLLRQRLQECTHVIVTLGTAWVYQLRESQKIVANCHQQPQSLFTKQLLETQQILEYLLELEYLIKSTKPYASIIFTLSPVRHTKDGMVENMHSKARLHDAIQQLCNKSKSCYFPSYEIMMDELRDYRFYKSDMLHPNEVAVDYIWSRFRESVIHKNSIPIIQAVEKIKKLQAHRPTNKIEHKKQVDKAVRELKTTYPNVKL
jgi:hypothetical protein